MRKALCVITLVALAAAANASTLNLWAGTSATDPGTVGSVPTVTPGETVYLWATTDAATTTPWIGLYMDVVGAESTDIYNAPLFSTFTRWNENSLLSFTGDGEVKGIGGVGSAQGLGSAMEQFNPTLQPVAGYYLVGEFVAGASNIYLGVGSGGIVRTSGVAGEDYVVFGDNAPIAGNLFDSLAANPVVIVPEPASMLLLGLAGLFIRRR